MIAEKSKSTRSQRRSVSKVNTTNKSKSPASKVPAAKAKKTKKQQARSPSRDSQADKVLYEAGTVLAFIDPTAADPEHFKIGMARQNVNQDSAEFQADVFEADSKSSLEFKRTVADTALFEQTIVMPIEKPAMTSEKTKGKKKITASIKIMRRDINQVRKNIPRVLKALESDGNESESDDEDELMDNKEEEQDKVESQPPKQILKIKGVKTKKTTVEAKKKAPAASKVSTRNGPKPEDEDIADEQQIDTGAAGGSKKSLRDKLQLGQKRGREQRVTLKDDSDEDLDQKQMPPSKKRKTSRNAKRSKTTFSDDEDAGESYEEAEEERKTSSAKGRSKTAANKQKKKPAVFKLGVWNPDITVKDFEPCKEDRSNELSTFCCRRCASRNVHRACWTGNFQLLQKCLHDKKHVAFLNTHWGPDDNRTPLMVLRDAGYAKPNSKFLELMLAPELKVPKGQEYQTVYDSLFSRDNQIVGEYLLHFVDTGKVSRMAYGTAIRQVGMTRGSRQGNNAFLQQCDKPLSAAGCTILNNPENILKSNNISKETTQTIEKLTQKSCQTMALTNLGVYSLHEFVINGYHVTASTLIKNAWEQSNYGLNELHYLSLREDLTDAEIEALPEKFKPVSVTKKATSSLQVTPLQCACINPNHKVLSTLLKMNPDINGVDQCMRKAVHYAAACSNPENLKLVISMGANVNDIDVLKTTAAHVAAKTGQAKNLAEILKIAPLLIKARDKYGNVPMAYACQSGHKECIDVLFQNGAKINTGVGKDRMTPIHYAAAHGRFELCQWLIENKAKVVSKDKYKRCPLTMAVRNGHSKVASLLLQHGADVEQADSSGNTPLHFAAAYGWMDCIELLVNDAKANLNSANSWKITPINIAMLKNHEGCVRQLLEYEGVDVNCKDEKGRNLLMLGLHDLNERSVEFVRYLLDKGADCNQADIDGHSAVHQLAFLDPWQGVPRHLQTETCEHQHWKEMWQRHQKIVKMRKEIQLLVADVLLERGADLTLKDQDGKSAFVICLERDNIDLMRKLQRGVSLNGTPDLFHQLTEKILDQRVQEILNDMLNQEQVTAESMNHLDSSGKTPVLAYISFFTVQYEEIRGKLMTIITEQAAKHGNDASAYTIDAKKLFASSNQSTTSLFSVPIKRGFGTQPKEAVPEVELPEETRQRLADDLMQMHVVDPFIKILQVLAAKGADLTAHVQKLKKFRELDAKRLEMMADEMNANRKKVDGVKKRDEVMREQQIREEVKRQQNREKKLDEKKQAQKEIEYDQAQGLMNCFHLIAKAPHPKLVDYLLGATRSQSAAMLSHKDWRGRTPFNYLSSCDGFNAFNPIHFVNYMNCLINEKVDIDAPDEKNRSPLLNFYQNKHVKTAERLLGLGADVNRMDASGLTVTKYALIRRDVAAIQDLVQKHGALINQVDAKGRNLLHHAVNMSSATADASFEVEQLLVDLGIDINALDVRGRTPIHYAFVKIRDWESTKQIDPIETVSSLCGIKGLKLDEPDLWERTPLHYASQRGASICAMYLEKRGACLESKDIYGNTPLGIALKSGHFNFGIIMIQKHADVKALVHHEDRERVAKMLRERQGLSANLSQADHDMIAEDQIVQIEEGESDDDAHKKRQKRRKMYLKNNDNNFYDNESDGSDVSNSDYDDSDDEFEQNAFRQNPYGNRQVFAQKTAPKKAAAGFTFGGGFNFPVAQEEEKKEPEEPVLVHREPISMFRVAIKAGQLGIAYLTLDQGYDLMRAIQDAMDEKKFQLVLTLMQKNPDDLVIQRRNEKQQTLLHILCQNAAVCPIEHLDRIYVALKKRGVSALAADSFGRTALHYAVLSNSVPLVERLLTGDGAKPNECDMYGYSCLALFAKGKAFSLKRIYNSKQGTVNALFKLLIQHGANPNIVFVEKEFQPEVGEKPYKSTLAINLIRSEQEDDELTRDGLLGLLLNNTKFSLTDSDGRDVLHYAIKQNRAAIVEFILENCKKADLQLNLQDVSGASHAHLAVQPLKYGSYENTDILGYLKRAGYDLNLKNGDGETPYDLACKQASGRMKVQLKNILGLYNDGPDQPVVEPFVPENQFPPQPDFSNDSELFLEQAHKKEQAELDEKKMRDLVPVDKTGRFERSYSVFIEEIENDSADRKVKRAWDCYLTKVDLKNGMHGCYVFYKMQLLHDRIRDLYVVFTRYGRIGEDGMNQRTPFNSIDEAKKEFCSIFKQKTGNNFVEPESFERQKKKYTMSQVNYCNVQHKDYLAPFDFDKCPKSKLEKNTRDLIEEIADFAMYSQAMQSFGIDQEILPFAKIDKAAISQAIKVLKEVKEVIEEDEKMMKSALTVDQEKWAEVKDKIMQLSSRFYELIPLQKYKDQIAPPFTNMSSLRASYDQLEQLLNVAFASKLLLGAQYNQVSVHPADYIYDALQVKLDYMAPGCGEHDLIVKYVEETHAGCYSKATHKLKIFKVQRKGEPERMAASETCPKHNRRLLFHGSQIFNFLGIFAQGLRIAPPEAPVTGYAFGKGVYFADMFQKSFQYSQSHFGGANSSSRSTLLMLCEVALGNSRKMWTPEYVENLPMNVHSVHGVGRNGPDPKGRVTMPNGVDVPAGPIIELKDYDPNPPKDDGNNSQQTGFGGGLFNAGLFGQPVVAPRGNNVVLAHNEFIVYKADQIRMRYIIQVCKKTKKDLQLEKQAASQLSQQD